VVKTCRQHERVEGVESALIRREWLRAAGSPAVADGDYSNDPAHVPLRIAGL